MYTPNVVSCGSQSDGFYELLRSRSDSSISISHSAASMCYFKRCPTKEIDRPSRFFWFPPVSIPPCSNKRPCSRRGAPNEYKGDVDIDGQHRRRPRPRRRRQWAFLSRNGYACNLLHGSWICLCLSLSSGRRVSAVYNRAHVSPLLIHFRGFGNHPESD